MLYIYGKELIDPRKSIKALKKSHQANPSISLYPEIKAIVDHFSKDGFLKSAKLSYFQKTFDIVNNIKSPTTDEAALSFALNGFLLLEDELLSL